MLPVESTSLRTPSASWALPVASWSAPLCTSASSAGLGTALRRLLSCPIAVEKVPRRFRTVARPMNITVYTEGTGVMSDDKLSALVAETFDLRPKGIIQMLDLLRPIYRKTAAYGHFGRDEPEFSWENVDRAEKLRDAAGLKGKVELAPA